MHNLKAWSLWNKNYTRIRSELNEMCNRKIRVSAGGRTALGMGTIHEARAAVVWITVNSVRRSP